MILNNKFNSINFGRVKPSFLIIGVQKGGTTSLHNYLSQHPKLSSPKKKELHFFDTNKSLNFNSYINYFPKHYFNNKLNFESTPRYVYFPNVAKKIFEFNPRMKFIVVLRNPVDRAFSAWNMYQQMKNNKKYHDIFYKHELNNREEKIFSLLINKKNITFNEWVKFEISDKFDQSIIEPSIVRRGYYKKQIEEYFEYFSKNQFLFLESESLKKETKKCLNLVSNFLKIESFDNLKINLEHSHKREYKETINDEVFNLLSNHYKKENKGLEELIGLELSWN